MSLLDPRSFILPSFLQLDPSTLALLSRFPTQSLGGGKVSTNSFRISDILESPPREEKGSPTENESEGERVRSASVESGRESSSLSSKKSRKARTIFTDKQLQELENMFDKHKYLSVQDRMDLAQRMGLTDTQVKTWYQNRRTKWKRQAAGGSELLQDSSNLAAVQHLLHTSPYWPNLLLSSLSSSPSSLLLPFLPQLGLTPPSTVSSNPIDDSSKPSSPSSEKSSESVK
ncbi:hypothetical protein PFISCL1PPCAC_24316, partial [Pristionchus fissidentatus]